MLITTWSDIFCPDKCHNILVVKITIYFYFWHILYTLNKTFDSHITVNKYVSSVEYITGSTATLLDELGWGKTMCFSSVKNLGRHVLYLICFSFEKLLGML